MLLAPWFKRPHAYESRPRRRRGLPAHAETFSTEIVRLIRFANRIMVVQRYFRSPRVSRRSDTLTACYETIGLLLLRV